MTDERMHGGNETSSVAGVKVSDLPKPQRVNTESSAKATARWIKLLPVTASIAVLGFLVMRFAGLGPVVSFEFDDDSAHGIMVGDTIRYRGIDIGKVTEVSLELKEVDGKRQAIPVVRARMSHDLESDQSPAKLGAQCFVEELHVNLFGEDTGGADTILSGKRIVFDPWTVDVDKPIKSSFLISSKSRAVSLPVRGDLVLFLNAFNSRGAPLDSKVIFNGQEIGEVHYISDPNSNGVTLRINIRKEHRHEVYTNNRFALREGFDLKRNGLNLELTADVEGAVRGGVVMYQPPSSERGELSNMHSEFVLHQEAQPEWKEWVGLKDASPIVGDFTGKQSSLSGELQWKNSGTLAVAGRFFTDSWAKIRGAQAPESHRQMPVNLLVTEKGFFLPAPSGAVSSETLSLITSADNTSKVETVLGDPSWKGNELYFYESIELSHEVAPISTALLVVPKSLQSCLVRFGGLEVEIGQINLQQEGGVWQVTAEGGWDEQWNGAAAYDLEGRVIGLFLVNTEGEAAIAPFTQEAIR